MMHRRLFLKRAAALIAAPALVRFDALMPISVPRSGLYGYVRHRWLEIDPHGVWLERHELLSLIINPPCVLHEDGSLHIMDTTIWREELSKLRAVSSQANPVPSSAQISPQFAAKLFGSAG